MNEFKINPHKGMVFKNYKGMCDELGIRYRTGRSKEIQLEELRKYFDYHKDGNKIIVDTVSTVHVLQLSHGYYSQDIEPLILSMLSEQYVVYGNKRIILSTKQIAERIGMINKNYRKYANKKKDLSMELNVSLVDIGLLYNMYESKLRYNIEYSLDDLHKRKHIKLKKVYMLCYSSTKKRKTRELKSDEMDKIREVEKTLLLKYGVSREYDLHLNGKMHEYRKELKEAINSRFQTDNIEFYYPAYKMKLSMDIIYDESLLKFIMDRHQEHESSLNKKLIDKCFIYYDKSRQKSNDRLEFDYGTLNTFARDTMQYKTTNDYVSNGYKLTEYLIKNDTS